MSAESKPPKRSIKRDAAASKRRIINAALKEFSRYGHAGARMDAIAEAAEVSKPMIYSYFGDKEELYKAALRESYVQIRQGERELQIDSLDPEDGIRELVRFTLNHFVSKPWFISMLNTENLLGGEAIKQISDVSEIQSPLIEALNGLLKRGVEDGIFRQDVDPVEIYISIASLCYFPVSNRHTLRVVFNVPIDKPWLETRAKAIAEMILLHLGRPPTEQA